MDRAYLQKFLDDFEAAFVFDENGALQTTPAQCARISELFFDHYSFISMYGFDLRLGRIDLTQRDMTEADNKVLLIHMYGMCLPTYTKTSHFLGVIPPRLLRGLVLVNHPSAAATTATIAPASSTK